MTTLATIKRRAIEHALELKRGNATAAAELLHIGRATIWRHLRDWKAQDRMMILSTARSVGVSEDEALCIVGQITPDDLAERCGYSRFTAYRRVDEACGLLKRRRVPWGLALLEKDHEDDHDDPDLPDADELRAFES